MMTYFREESVKMIKYLANWHLLGADELGDVAGCIRGKAFFEGVDAVIFGSLLGQTLNTVEIIAFEMMLGGVFDHVPLDGVLSVVFFHILFIGAGKEIYYFVAVGHKHGGG